MTQSSADPERDRLLPGSFRARGVEFAIRILRRFCRETGYPARARHMEWSLLLSVDDAPRAVSDRLLDLAEEAVGHARQVSTAQVAARMTEDFPVRFPSVWPGEHYKLLAGLVLALKPKLVVEIGTGEGLSSLTMVPHLPADGRLVTFDLVHWADYPRTCLCANDFADGRLQQVLDDLSKDEAFARAEAILRRADLVFMDGPKNWSFEENMVSRFSSMRFESSPIFVFDDIRLWPMIRFWRDLTWPKLDLTSYGHWTGTGLAELGGRHIASTHATTS